jgi:hypothetical protein
MAALLLLCLGTSGVSQARAELPPAPEYAIKAAYLFNFAKFVEWPAGKLTDPRAPFIVGLVGPEPIAGLLEQTIQGKSIRGKKIELRYFAPGQNIDECHLLFISRQSKAPPASVLSSVKSTGVLTVSEVEGFADVGGMINFVVLEGNVKLEINLGAAEQAGLKLSSRLMGVGRLIKPAPKSKPR